MLPSGIVATETTAWFPIASSVSELTTPTYPFSKSLVQPCDYSIGVFVAAAMLRG